jgi:hypothetical protein
MFVTKARKLIHSYFSECVKLSPQMIGTPFHIAPYLLNSMSGNLGILGQRFLELLDNSTE